MTHDMFKPPRWNSRAPVSVTAMKQVLEATDEMDAGWVQQFIYFTKLFAEIRDVPGPVVECGLGLGTSFEMLAFLTGMSERPAIMGFDSFEGWPEPTAADRSSPRDPQKGEWGLGMGVTEERIWQRLQRSGIRGMFSKLDISIVPGFLAHTLPGFIPHYPVAFAHIDVDLEESYRDALRFLFPQMAVGGIIALDEYREFRPYDPAYIGPGGEALVKWPGCDIAVDEFLAEANKSVELTRDSSTGKYWIKKLA